MPINKNALPLFQEGVWWPSRTEIPRLHGVSCAQGTVGPQENGYSGVMRITASGSSNPSRAITVFPSEFRKGSPAEVGDRDQAFVRGRARRL